ncbi:MAG: acVLRF1 family peptidyl-tRNA hydrolase [Nocardioidaceae bacterium]
MPFGRLEGWLERYDAAHAVTAWVVSAERAESVGADGARAVISVPFGRLAMPSIDTLLAHVAVPRQFGVVLVRRGGFAVARVIGEAVVESKVGQRHVQGRTKAGGWSQQRFARRRDNQARAAYDAAAEYVRGILQSAAAELDLLATGGDRQAVAATLEHPGLDALRSRPQHWLGGVPDPKRRVLDAAIQDVRSVTITLIDAPRPP